MDFIEMTGSAQLAVQSMDAAGSLSMADANFDGVKHHDISKVSAGNQVLTAIIGGAAFLGIACGLLAMWIEESSIAYVAFFFPLITGPYLIFQRRKIQWLPTFVDESNKLRLHVNDLAAKRAALEIQNGRFERQAKRLSGVEERFRNVAHREGKSVVAMRALVREGAAIQKEIWKAQEEFDTMELFKIIMKADKNGDNKVSENEARKFLLQLKVFAEGRGKTFDESKIRAAFKNTVRTSSTFDLVASSLSQENQTDEVVDDGFVKLHKLPAVVEPRVSATGLVLPGDNEEDEGEGGPAHPIVAERAPLTPPDDHSSLLPDIDFAEFVAEMIDEYIGTPKNSRYYTIPERRRRKGDISTIV